MRRTHWSLVPVLTGVAALLSGGHALATPGDDQAPGSGGAAPPAVSAEPSAADLVKDLQKAYYDARRAYYEAVQAAKQEHGNDWRKHVGATAEQQVLPRYVAAAERFAGTDDAVPFLIKVVEYAPRANDVVGAKAALTTLRDRHAGSAKLSGLTYTLMRGDRQFGEDLVVSTLERILATNQHDAVKCAMLFARGSRATGPQATEAARTSALADLRKASELGKGTSFGTRAASTIFELERLQIGMVAPDIEGQDLDGVAFKLSDYRGKVVVLDFWGDW